MGNRAVIAHSKDKHSTAIYAHWNGGPESVLAFLAVCKQRGYRDTAMDTSYAMARLTGVMHEFFDGGLSLGIGPLGQLDVDNMDNGAYLIGADWTVTTRFGKGHDTIMRVEQLGPQGRETYDAIVAQLTKVPA